MSLLEALEQGATVVTASARLARHLRWRFDVSQSARGESAWRSADVLPWGAWLERIYRTSAMNSADDPAAEADLLTAPQAKLVWRNVIAERPSASILSADPYASAQTVLEAWQLMRAWQIPIEAVRKSSRSADTDAFAAWAGEFQTRCRDQGWVDPASLADRIVAGLERGRSGLSGPTAFAGFDEPNAQQTRLQSSIPAPAGAADPDFAAGMRRVDCADPDHERVLAARWARHMLEEQGAGVIGIIVPDLARQAGAYRRSFLDILAPDWRSRTSSVLPVNVAHGSPLARTGLVHAGLLLLKMSSGRLNYRELGELLRSPYLRGADRESGDRAALDIRVRERSEQEIDLRQLRSTAAEKIPPGFLEVLDATLDWAGRHRERLRAGPWAASFAQLLQQTGWPGERALNSDEQQALQAWGNLLQTFSSCGRMTGEIGRAAAWRLLNDLGRDQIFQPEGPMDGVQIMAPRDAAGHRFDGLWVTSLSSDVWPPAARPNALIPFDLLESHGVPGATPLRVRDATVRIMAGLAAAAPVTLASWPGVRDQETLVASPMLPAQTVDSDALAHYAADTHRERIFASRRLETLATDPAPPLTEGMNARGGSQLLKWQAACPARAFFEFRLGAREMPVPAYGVDALQRGNIIHDALETLYSEIKSLGAPADIDAETLEELIDGAIQRALRKHIPRHHPLARTLSSNEERRSRGLLEILVNRDRARPPFVIDAVECEDEVTVGTLSLHLRQDRIDRLPGGERLVLDYKTGAKFSLSGWAGERPAEPQLPLYAATTDVQGIAVILLNHDGVKISGVGTDALAVLDLKTAVEFTGDERADWSSIVRGWDEAMKNLADEFARGDCRIDSRDPKPASGEFAMLTRVQTHLAGSDR